MLLIRPLIFHLQVLIRLLSTPQDLTTTIGSLMRSWWECVLTDHIHYCMWVFVTGDKVFSVEVNKHALTTVFVQRWLLVYEVVTKQAFMMVYLNVTFCKYITCICIFPNHTSLQQDNGFSIVLILENWRQWKWKLETENFINHPKIRLLAQHIGYLIFITE